MEDSKKVFDSWSNDKSRDKLENKELFKNSEVQDISNNELKSFDVDFVPSVTIEKPRKLVRKISGFFSDVDYDRAIQESLKFQKEFDCLLRVMQNAINQKQKELNELHVDYDICGDISKIEAELQEMKGYGVQIITELKDEQRYCEAVRDARKKYLIIFKNDDEEIVKEANGSYLTNDFRFKNCWRHSLRTAAVVGAVGLSSYMINQGDSEAVNVALWLPPSVGSYVIVTLPPVLESEDVLNLNWSAFVPDRARLILPVRLLPLIVIFLVTGVPTSVEREADDALAVIVGETGLTSSTVLDDAVPWR